MDLPEAREPRLRDRQATVDLCLDGDADDPAAQLTLQVYLPEDAWLAISNVTSLRDLAATLLAAADAVDDLMVFPSAADTAGGLA